MLKRKLIGGLRSNKSYLHLPNSEQWEKRVCDIAWLTVKYKFVSLNIEHLRVRTHNRTASYFYTQSELKMSMDVGSNILVTMVLEDSGLKTLMEVKRHGKKLFTVKGRIDQCLETIYLATAKKLKNTRIIQNK